jgi:hypothetical protein
MKFDPAKWALIDELAENEGVPMATRKKWKARGIPSAWQIRFVQARPGSLSFADFARRSDDEIAA